MRKKNYDNIYVKPFSSNPGTSRTDGRADRRADRIAVSISRVSVLRRDEHVLTELKQNNEL